MSDLFPLYHWFHGENVPSCVAVQPTTTAASPRCCHGDSLPIPFPDSSNNSNRMKRNFLLLLLLLQVAAIMKSVIENKNKGGSSEILANLLFRIRQGSLFSLCMPLIRTASIKLGTTFPTIFSPYSLEHSLFWLRRFGKQNR